MSFVKSVLGSCPLAYIFFALIAATAGPFVHLLIPMHDLLSDHFELENLPQISYAAAIIAATIASLVVFIVSNDNLRDYVCFVALALVSPTYSFLLYSVYARKWNYITYMVFIGISGLLFGAISTSLLSAAATLNSITSTSYVFGTQLGTLVYSLLYYYISYNPDQYSVKLRSEVLLTMHLFPAVLAICLSLIFIIYIKSASVADAQRKNDANDDGAGTGRLGDNLSDLVNTYIASGMIAFSVLVESGFVPNLIPRGLNMVKEESLTIIILNAFYAALGALISGIIPLFPQSLAFKCILWPINLLRVPALIFASQNKILEVTQLYIYSAVTFSGMLHGYSVGSSFASLSGLSKANKRKAFELNSFIFILFMAIGSGCSIIYVKFA